MIDKNFKKIAVLLGVTVSLLLVWWFYYSVLTFRVVSVSPNPPNFPTSMNRVDIQFNKKLKPESNGGTNISTNLTPAPQFVFSEKSLTLYLSDTPLKNTEFSIRLHDITAANGATLSENIAFAVKFVEFNDLPQKEQERQIESSSSFENSFPLIHALPLTTGYFDIGYKLPSFNNTKMPIVITVKTRSVPVPPPDTPKDDPRMINYLNHLRKYRGEALEYLNNNGFNRDQYQLFVDEPYLLEEFNAKHNNN